MSAPKLKPRPRRCSCGRLAFETLELCGRCIGNLLVAAFFDGYRP